MASSNKTMSKSHLRYFGNFLTVRRKYEEMKTNSEAPDETPQNRNIVLKKQLPPDIISTNRTRNGLTSTSPVPRPAAVILTFSCDPGTYGVKKEIFGENVK